MAEENLFKKLLSDRAQATQPSPDTPIPQPKNKTGKRGRPATGKRSDDDYVGRTFYIDKETDLDIEEVLLKLKRSGVDGLDKSELVNRLLSAWLKWHKGENPEIQLSGISPIQK